MFYYVIDIAYITYEKKNVKKIYLFWWTFM